MSSEPFLPVEVGGSESSEDLASVIGNLHLPDLSSLQVRLGRWSASLHSLHRLLLAFDLLLAFIYGLASVCPPARPARFLVALHHGSGVMPVPERLCELYCPVLCFSMLFFALEHSVVVRTLRWKVTPRIRSHLPGAPHMDPRAPSSRRNSRGTYTEEVWTKSRFSVGAAMFVGILVLVMSIVICSQAICSPIGLFQVTVMTLVPLVTGLPQFMMSALLVHFLTVSMKKAVTKLRDSVRRAGEDEEVWSRLVQDYRHLRQDLTEFGDHCGWLIVVQLVMNMWASYLFLMFSLDSDLVVGWRCLAVAMTMLGALNAIMKLRPLADITGLCQSTAFGSDSLLTVAVEGGHRQTAHCSAFATYVRNCPTGIILPGSIHVTHSLIINCLRVLVLYSSTAALFALKWVLGGPHRADAQSA